MHANLGSVLFGSAELRPDQKDEDARQKEQHGQTHQDCKAEAGTPKKRQRPRGKWLLCDRARNEGQEDQRE